MITKQIKLSNQSKDRLSRLKGKTYEALIKAWCISKDLPTDEDTLSKYFKLHLERGISYLSGTNFIKNLNDLLNLASEGEKYECLS